jgi:hypothetical protein
MTPAEMNRFLTLSRLSEGDRIIWQKPHAVSPRGGVWWDKHPQLGRPKPWLSTFHFFVRRGYVVEGLPAAGSVYRGDSKTWPQFVITPAGLEAFLGMEA